jgi:hypothetical protein
MKRLLALIVVLFATAALAQQDDAPPAGPSGKPVHAKSKAPAPKGPPKSLAEKLLACLEIDDESKERLDCYDATIPPNTKPRQKSTPANGVMDCRYVKEEDERLKCFNGFAEKIPKFSSR